MVRQEAKEAREWPGLFFHNNPLMRINQEFYYTILILYRDNGLNYLPQGVQLWKFPVLKYCLTENLASNI